MLVISYRICVAEVVADTARLRQKHVRNSVGDLLLPGRSGKGGVVMLQHTCYTRDMCHL